MTLPFSKQHGFDLLPTQFRAVATFIGRTGQMAVVMDRAISRSAMAEPGMSGQGVFGRRFESNRGRLLGSTGARLEENLPSSGARNACGIFHRCWPT